MSEVRRESQNPKPRTPNPKLMTAPLLQFILGASRSGKSRYAESLAAASGLPVRYVATYSSDEADEEMQHRIALHRKRRPHHWHTIENRFDLRNQVLESEGALLLVDCVTLWLSYHFTHRRAVESILAELQEALEVALELRRNLILVSDEVGGGLVPLTPEGRAFRDLAGSANQLMAQYATKVELVVAGLPLVLKGK
jgi:adenosylcobinamide kinase/adenosylcobinamide-phosphate guanylyltransferase